MEITELRRLFDEFMKVYPEQQKIQVWERQSAQFRKFWEERIIKPDSPELTDDEIDDIIRILDTHGKGNNKFSETIANVLIPQGAFRRMFRAFRSEKKIAECINTILKCDNAVIRQQEIDRLYQLNESIQNKIGNLTGKSGNAINCLLAAYNPFTHSSIVSLNDRFRLLNSLGIDYYPASDSIGTQIEKTSELIKAFFANEGFTRYARTVSCFVYHSKFKDTWKPQEEKLDTAHKEFVIQEAEPLNYNQSSNNGKEKQFWWLNANPKFWNIDQYKIGQIQYYTTHNDAGNKRRIYEYFRQVKPGDLVIGYQTTPVLRVKALFEVNNGISEDEEGQEVISFLIKEFFPYEPSWEEMKSNDLISKSEVFINNQGSLFKLSASEFNAIIDLCRNGKQEKLKKYSFEDALSEIFLTEDQLKSTIELLEYKKNIILQGPPGTGKTFIAKRLAYLAIGVKDISRVEMIQFHQSYSYEDFIQGYRPCDNNSFKLRNGVFYDFCLRATRDPEHKYFFIIDEINRGNLSKIFGELMMLIEHDKRGEEFGIRLTYSDADSIKFFIPENLYIIGTMNTADRSLAIVDYALRRRFAFIDIKPAYKHHRFTELLNASKTSPIVIEKIKTRMEELNTIIAGDDNLGKWFCVGHSYFCSHRNGSDSDWYRQIIHNEIGPLLREYWFDDDQKAEENIKKLLRD